MGKRRCLAEGCVPENHDLCLCGHPRMDHLMLAADDGGGCWGTGTDCWPRCLTFVQSTDDEEPIRFFKQWKEEFGVIERPDQDTADEFRERWMKENPR